MSRCLANIPKGNLLHSSYSLIQPYFPFVLATEYFLVVILKYEVIAWLMKLQSPNSSNACFTLQEKESGEEKVQGKEGGRLLSKLDMLFSSLLAVQLSFYIFNLWDVIDWNVFTN